MPDTPILELDLREAGIRTVCGRPAIVPTIPGCEVPVLTPRGELRHQAAWSTSPGSMPSGCRFCASASPSLIDGVGDDASALSAHLRAYLDGNSIAA